MTALGDLAWPDVARQDHDEVVLVVPIGSTEQHGPHLPLSTDTDIAVGIANRLAAGRRGIVVAPPVAYGSSGEHQAFAGTISIGPEATTSLIVELVRSASGTFHRILLLSTHGGNAEALGRAVCRLHGEGTAALLWSPDWAAEHAGRVETSVMLALRPQQVRVDSAAAGNVAPLEQLWAELRTGRLAVIAPNGVLGDPTAASAEEGEVLLTAAIEHLARAIERWPEQA